MTDCIPKEITREAREKRSKARTKSILGQCGSARFISTDRHFSRKVRGELKRDYGYKVEEVFEYDETGMAYIPHAQVDINMIVKNDKIVFLEIRQEASEADVYTLAKKAELYEKKHNKKPSALLIMSIILSPKGKLFLEHYGISHFSFTSKLGDALCKILE
jgi:hypothetical protein